MIDDDVKNPVHVWRERINIPTYETGAADPNPCFLESRVYQGSSGAVYPFPVIESVSDQKTDREYDAIILENEYLRIMVLSELGGRVQMALDKTNKYHFVYYNRVIKPALVALAGPWISGGIEFNWPQHHRPSTFHPVEADIIANNDGSWTVWCNEIDRMVGTRGMHGFTLHPGKAYLEVKVRLSNRTPLPETFLWWANPAVHADENHQSIFPPDVFAVMDHGKRDVSAFPIATGEYYKVDYSPGTDISRYKNIPVPTSYMAYHSDYDFVGSYDHGKQAGLLHVADHHISPGKKQWTWGCGEFGQAWDRHLTDEDGPYIELMCGVFTDNQPDFSWLSPGEEKSFSQYFMPYKGVGAIKNATIDAVVGLETEGEQLVARVYTTAAQTAARLQVQAGSSVVIDECFDSSPEVWREFRANWNIADKSARLSATVYDANGAELVSYSPRSVNPEIPEPARAIADPKQLDSIESLYLAGMHLEQYRHATRRPEEYYREALARDPGDMRSNLALGKLLYRRGCYVEAESYLLRAIKRATRHNPNPHDGEYYYVLGLVLVAERRYSEAEDAFHKSCWNANTKVVAWFELARFAARQKNWGEAEKLLSDCLATNARHHQAKHLLAAVYVQLDRREAALVLIEAELQVDPFNIGMLFELAYSLDGPWGLCDQRLGTSSQNYICVSIDYAAAGMYDRAMAVLRHWLEHSNESSERSLVLYHLASLEEASGNTEQALTLSCEAADLPRHGFFPNRLQDLAVLQAAVERYSSDYRALYDLGNLLYSKRRYEEAIHAWEDACNLSRDFAQPHRNLGIAYFNHRQDPELAWQSLSQAHCIDPKDARVLYELDQLAKRLNHDAAQRLSRLEQYSSCVARRDDLSIERIALLNELGRHQDALELLLQRQFHPWEGGEGKVSAQYVLCNTELARRELVNDSPQRAIQFLTSAMHWPESLGEGRLPGLQENNIHYWLGTAHRMAGDEQQAVHWFERASAGLSEPTSMQYYNDQPPEMIFYQGLALRALGKVAEASQRFQKLLDFGRENLNVPISIDFFAVSLPDFLVFKGDLELKNQLHCRFMQALGHLGLQNYEEAKQQFKSILELDVNHLGALTHINFDPIIV